MSFIEQARRNQIVACAIETIAELGYAQASLAQIGQRANISKGVITYHFASKEELMQAVVDDVFSRFATFVAARVMDDKPWEMLQTLLQANADFLKAHRTQLLTLFEIAHNAHDLALHGHNRELDVERITKLLTDGQQQGVFRNFDVQVMASSIVALRDNLIAQSAKNANLDVDHYCQEIITLVNQAIRRSS
ncbi:MAG: TetR/AcrR family transcriptional regulator [Chloroflexaceae bacterium]|nr:TetR/AcrR family transcriptional regulator [Chloroflexaceae bacterium]